MHIILFLNIFSVPTSARFHSDTGEVTLCVSPATVDDGGTYTCTATNDVGTVASSACLRVQGTSVSDAQHEHTLHNFAYCLARSHGNHDNSYFDVSFHSGVTVSMVTFLYLTKDIRYCLYEIYDKLCGVFFFCFFKKKLVMENVSNGQLLSYERAKKTLENMLLLETIYLWHGNSNSASTSHHSGTCKFRVSSTNTYTNQSVKS